jgi:hypothetical protein
VNFCLGEAVEARNAMPEPEQQQALRWINEGASEAMGRAITQTIEWTAAEYREPLLPVTTYAEDHGGAAYSYADDLINGRLFGQWRKEVRDGALRAFDQAMAEFGVDMIGIRYRGLLDFLDQPYRYGQTSYTEFVMSAWANAGRGD